MSEIMIVMMVVMLIAVFGSGHKGMMQGHGGAANTEQTRNCVQSGQPDCTTRSGEQNESSKAKP